MMTATATTSYEHPMLIPLNQLPALNEDRPGTIVQQLAEYFMEIIKTHRLDHENAPYLMVPSACDLAGFFHCSELHIFEALRRIAESSFEYEIRGLDGPITLRDPVGRINPFGGNLPPQKIRWPWSDIKLPFQEAFQGILAEPLTDRE